MFLTRHLNIYARVCGDKLDVFKAMTGRFPAVFSVTEPGILR